jgi:hypothetical protein
MPNLPVSCRPCWPVPALFGRWFRHFFDCPARHPSLCPRSFCSDGAAWHYGLVECRFSSSLMPRLLR